MTGRFYVYHLVDPRDGKPFYVGKGQRTRGNDHVKNIATHAKDSQHPKDRRIREIIGAGLDVEVKIVERFALEADALEREREEISSIGIDSLTNLLSGYDSEKANMVKQASGATAPASIGRPTSYTDALASEICLRVSLGENLNTISQQEGFPAQSTIYRWLDEKPGFQENYERARARRADSRSDRMDDVARKVEMGVLDPAAARVIIDNEKWQAGKEHPKRYGDKLQQEVTGKDGKDLIPEQLSDLDLARRIAFVLSKAGKKA